MGLIRILPRVKYVTYGSLDEYKSEIMQAHISISHEKVKLLRDLDRLADNKRLENILSLSHVEVDSSVLQQKPIV